MLLLLPALPPRARRLAAVAAVAAEDKAGAKQEAAAPGCGLPVAVLALAVLALPRLRGCSQCSPWLWLRPWSLWSGPRWLTRGRHKSHSHPFSFIMWASSMMYLPSLYFWLDSNATSCRRSKGSRQAEHSHRALKVTPQPQGTYIFPAEGGLAALAVDVGHGMQACQQHPLLRWTAPHVHSATVGAAHEDSCTAEPPSTKTRLEKGPEIDGAPSGSDSGAATNRLLTRN